MTLSIEQLYQLFLLHPVISTDTRKISPGSLFFALRGDKFDANTFALAALEAGAAYAVIDNPLYDNQSDKLILVNDVLTTLQDLARHHRKQLTIPVIGLTGSNGKTTTKELINSVLSQRFKTLATQGNLNNHIGVPLTILTINSSHDMAVIEMGANHQKEIALLCSIAQPSIGLITNVGKAHLEGFGGMEGVKIGKGELYDWLSADERHEAGNSSGRTALINSGDPVLMEMQAAKGLKHVVYYGTGSSGDLISGTLSKSSPMLTVQWIDNKTSTASVVPTQLTGAYNLPNILAAICIGVHFNLTTDEINKGIECYEPRNNRSQVMKTAANTLICDYYNANPSSMSVAIDNIDRMDSPKKVLILGDMFEMGPEALSEHRAIIEKAVSTPVYERIFIGKDFFEAGKLIGNEGATINSSSQFYETADEVIDALKSQPITGATVLIKGSRGMALERLIDLL